MMVRRKHKPQRTCIVCRQVKEKPDLFRIVRTPEKMVVLDPTGKANGRGVYLCQDKSCWEKGLKKERLSHALKISVSSKDVDALRGALKILFSNK